MPSQQVRRIGRRSRRDEVLAAALELFRTEGVSSVTATDLARAVGMTSTAIRYHFATTDDLLHALTADFFAELDSVMARHPTDPAWPSGVEQLVADFVEVVLANRDVALLIHQDNHLSGREEFGKRLDGALLQIRRAITGPRPTSEETVAAVSAIGGIWRPIEILAPIDVADHIDAIVGVILSGHPRG